MTSFTQRLRTALNGLALLVGRIVIRLALVAALVVAVGLLASAMGAGDHASAPAPAPTSATPAVDSSGVAPHDRPTTAPLTAPVPAGMAVHLSEADCAQLGIESNHRGQCQVTVNGERVDVVAISATDDAPTHPGVDLLLEAGYTGEYGDRMSAVYAPVDLVLFDETGTWTVTVDGLARCEHGSDHPCTGDERIGLRHI